MKSVSKCHVCIWEKIFSIARERPPRWNFLHFYLKSVKSMPKAATTGYFFLTISETLFESPWSPCQNATYVFEKKCSLLFVKGHPGEIFSTFILSPWSQCQKRRPQVNFLAFTETFSVSPWSPCPNATYAFKENNILNCLWKATQVKILALLS